MGKANSQTNPKSTNNKFWQFRNLADDDQKAELLLYGDISERSWWEDAATPKRFADDLAALGDVKEITVYINSGGGDVFAAQAIGNMLERNAATVTAHIDGLCASAATIVACHADKVVAAADGSYMVHPVSMGVCDYLTAEEMLTEVKNRYDLNAAGRRMIEDLRQRQRATNRHPTAILAIMKNDPGAFRADLGYFRTSPTKPFMGPSVRNAPPVFQAHVLKGSPMIGLSGTGERSKSFLVQFKSKHIGMVQRQLGVPADKDYTESGKERWKPNEKLVTMSSPSGSAMHHTVWEMQETTVEQMLQDNTERRIRQLIANAKRKGVI